MADIQTLTKEKIKLDEPGLYDVLFLNDNITTMEFVIRVLKQIFGHIVASGSVVWLHLACLLPMAVLLHKHNARASEAQKHWKTQAQSARYHQTRQNAS